MRSWITTDSVRGVRRLVTGVDDAGRSCVVETTEVNPIEFMPGVALYPMFETDESPPSPRAAGRAPLVPTKGPGLVQWNVVVWEPGVEVPVHHTSTIDFDVVLSGHVELILADGAHELGPGDCVVLTGVDHGWRTGSEGCRLSTTVIGTAPPG